MSWHRVGKMKRGYSMGKQLSIFENEGYLPGYGPKDKEVGEGGRTTVEATKVLVGDFEPRGGVIACRTGGEQAERLARLLSDGYCHTVVEIMQRLKIGDPRSVIRDLRKAGFEVLDKWEISKGGNRYKCYWINK